jgi:hypothetical protein
LVCERPDGTLKNVALSRNAGMLSLRGVTLSASELRGGIGEGHAILDCGSYPSSKVEHLFEVDELLRVALGSHTEHAQQGKGGEDISHETMAWTN